MVVARADDDAPARPASAQPQPLQKGLALEVWHRLRLSNPGLPEHTYGNMWTRVILHVTGVLYLWLHALAKQLEVWHAKYVRVSCVECGYACLWGVFSIFAFSLDFSLSGGRVRTKRCFDVSAPRFGARLTHFQRAPRTPAGRVVSVPWTRSIERTSTTYMKQRRSGACVRPMTP